jgi:hypothetical protein
MSLMGKGLSLARIRGSIAMGVIQGVASALRHELFQGGVPELRLGLIGSREVGEDTMLLTDVSLFQGRSSTLRCGLV